MKATEAKNPRATLSESNLNGFLSCIYDLRTGRKKSFPQVLYCFIFFNFFPSKSHFSLSLISEKKVKSVFWGDFLRCLLMEDVFWPQDGEVHHYLTVIIDPTAVLRFPLMDWLVLDQ